MHKLTHHPKVLHVDGNTTAAKTLTAILRIYNYDAIHVYTSAEALVWCRLNWPDVVIADLTAEPVDGIQFATRIVSGQPTRKVLFLADPLAASQLLTQSIEANHDFPIFAKPVDPQKIIDYLATV